MAQGKNSTGLTDLLLKHMSEPVSMLSMLEWLCAQLMEAEVSGIVGAEKNAHSPSRSDYRCGYRSRRLDTRMGTMYLMVPKLRKLGLLPKINKKDHKVAKANWRICVVFTKQLQLWSKRKSLEPLRL